MIRARLGEIELGDLLRTLEGGRKNAVIEPTCPKLTGRIHLREGKIAYIHTTPGPHLGEFLVRFDYLTLEQVQELVKYQQQENPGTPLGLLALQQKMLTESELTEVLRAQILDALAWPFTGSKSPFSLRWSLLLGWSSLACEQYL